jgi:hypothetical protein
MYILQFSDKPFMLKVLGKETRVEKEGEGYWFSSFATQQFQQNTWVKQN